MRKENRPRGRPGRKRKHQMSPLERFIGRIPHADIYCSDGTKSRVKFDIVSMNIDFNNTVDDVSAFVRQNVSGIEEIARNKLEHDTAFTRYGVPVDDLVLVDFLLRGKVDMLLVFERRGPPENHTNNTFH